MIEKKLPRCHIRSYWDGNEDDHLWWTLVKKGNSPIATPEVLHGRWDDHKDQILIKAQKWAKENGYDLVI